MRLHRKGTRFFHSDGLGRERSVDTRHGGDGPRGGFTLVATMSRLYVGRCEEISWEVQEENHLVHAIKSHSIRLNPISLKSHYYAIESHLEDTWGHYNPIKSHRRMGLNAMERYQVLWMQWLGFKGKLQGTMGISTKHAKKGGVSGSFSL